MGRATSCLRLVVQFRVFMDFHVVTALDALHRRGYCNIQVALVVFFLWTNFLKQISRNILQDLNNFVFI